MEDNIRRDCHWYDYGRTAPSAYGAFCEIQKKCLDHQMCKGCSLFKVSER